MALEFSLTKAIYEYNLVAQSGWNVPVLETSLDENQKEAVRKVWTIVTGVLTGAYGNDTIADLHLETQLLLEQNSPPTVAMAFDALAVGVEAGVVPTESVTIARDLVESFGAGRVSVRLCSALGVKPLAPNDPDGNETQVGEITSDKLWSDEVDSLNEEEIEDQSAELDQTCTEHVPLDDVKEFDRPDDTGEAIEPEAAGEAIEPEAAGEAIEPEATCEAIEPSATGEEATATGEAIEPKVTDAKALVVASDAGKCGAFEGRRSERVPDVLPKKNAAVGLSRCLLFSSPVSQPSSGRLQGTAESLPAKIEDEQAWPSLITEEEKQIRAEKKVRDDAAHAKRKEKMRQEKRKAKEEADRIAAEKLRAEAERRGRENAERLARQRSAKIAQPPVRARFITQPPARQPAMSGGLIWGVNNFCGNRSCTMCYPSSNSS